MHRLKSLLGRAGRYLISLNGNAAAIAAMALLIGCAHQKQFDEEVSQEVARREQRRCPAAASPHRINAPPFFAR